MGYAVVGMVLFAFAYLTLIRNSNNQMLYVFSLRFWFWQRVLFCTFCKIRFLKSQAMLSFSNGCI